MARSLRLSSSNVADGRLDVLGPDGVEGGQWSRAEQGIVHRGHFSHPTPRRISAEGALQQPAQRKNGGYEAGKSQHGAPPVAAGQVAGRQRGQQEQLVAVGPGQQVQDFDVAMRLGPLIVDRLAVRRAAPVPIPPG